MDSYHSFRLTRHALGTVSLTYNFDAISRLPSDNLVSGDQLTPECLGHDQSFAMYSHAQNIIISISRSLGRQAVPALNTVNLSISDIQDPSPH